MNPEDGQQLICDLELAFRGVHLSDHDAVVIADLHLGRGFSAGVEVPSGAMGNVESRLTNVLSYFEPQTVILAGDVLDAFDTVPPGVQDQLDALIDLIQDSGSIPRLLSGNHDTMLSALIEQPIDAYLEMGDTLIAHGHEPLPDDFARYVIGHHHPCLQIEGVKHPAYLLGRLRCGADLIVLPAFSDSLRGTKMNAQTLSAIEEPLLTDADCSSLWPVVLDPTGNDPLAFPTFEKLRHFL